jgi:isobutyryl-CoA mutase small subunit
VMELLGEKGMRDVIVFVGGIIPNQDIAPLQEMGVAAVFLPGASTEDVIRKIESSVPA